MNPEKAALLFERPVASRIRFSKTVSPDSRIVNSFTEPETSFAVSNTIQLDELFSMECGEALKNEFYVLFIPKNSSALLDREQEIHAWIGNGSSLVDLGDKNGRVRWKKSCLIVESSEEWMRNILPDLTEFVFHETALRNLEQTVASDLIKVKQDIHLTHGVTGKDLKKQPHVNERTVHATCLRMERLALEQKFYAPSSSLSHGLPSRLIEQAGIEERLELLENQLEILEDIYELANDRLGEFSYFFKEAWLEIGIGFLLIAEVVIMLFELQKL